MNILTKSTEMINIIKKSSSVFLMAHKDLDIDAISSCIGMYFFLREKNKEVYVIIDDVHQELGVKKILDLVKNRISIIKSKKVDELKDENSLLIILDTSKAKLTQNPDIISSFNKIINIDHHDKTDESLKSNLMIIDESASSTCEMVSFFLKDEKVKVTSDLATLLLTGIFLDTNYYQLKTCANTFYISYYLMECGAKITEVNELLKQDLIDYAKRQKIISSVKVIKNVAIGKGLQRSEYKKEDIAKTADSLLSFSKIKASFVIAKISKEVIGISGRSTGEINVGKILENFGGGGDEEEAAARIENSNVNKVIDELKKIIRNL